jgi:hypothetical protein
MKQPGTSKNLQGFSTLLLRSLRLRSAVLLACRRLLGHELHGIDDDVALGALVGDLHPA